MYIAIIYRGRERREGRVGGRGYGEREKGGREGGDNGYTKNEADVVRIYKEDAIGGKM